MIVVYALVLLWITAAIAAAGLLLYSLTDPTARGVFAVTVLLWLLFNAERDSLRRRRSSASESEPRQARRRVSAPPAS